MDVEQEYMDVLQNIESAISEVFYEEPLLVDFDVENALEALSNHYLAQATHHAPRRYNLNERAQKVYAAMQAMCDWRLGGAAPEGFTGPAPAVVNHEVILACLKRIRKSVQLWNKEGGRQGYLTYIGRFIV